MDVVHLPILPATSPLKDAVRAMRVQQTSAVLRETPTDLGLIKIPKVFRALGQQLTELASVKISAPVYRLTPAEISSWQLDQKHPRNTEVRYNNFLDSVNHQYALIDTFLGSALIVTRHEPQGDEIRVTPSDCYCDGPDEHSYPPPNVSSGPCPNCIGIVHCE